MNGQGFFRWFEFGLGPILKRDHLKYEGARNDGVRSANGGKLDRKPSQLGIPGAEWHFACSVCLRATGVLSALLGSVPALEGHNPTLSLYCRAKPTLLSQPFQAWIYHCHLHPLQAANCCRNSRLVVDEYDLIGLKIKENCYVLVNQFRGNFHPKTFCYRKIRSVFRDVIWRLTLTARWSPLVVRIWRL